MPPVSLPHELSVAARVVREVSLGGFRPDERMRGVESAQSRRESRIVCAAFVRFFQLSRGAQFEPAMLLRMCGMDIAASP